ncbi:DUF4258 domain-containing protein [Thiohalospira sp.]|uniref:DUF4258 domain-containing protein n=1 Tax=Thiohalospira sp. TaxID=3080549 RepID=UPI00397FB21C
MSALLERIQGLVRAGEVRISEHGYDELADDGISARELLSGVGDAVLVEDYPDYPKGPCSLVLQWDARGSPLHAVWGIPKGHDAPAVLITAYRPDPARWHSDFRKRR